MTANPSNFDPGDRHAEERDPVWRLLAQSPRPEPDAWFAVRTVARCRLAGSVEPRGVVLDRVWRWALGAGLATCLAMFSVTRLQPSSPAHSNGQKGVQEAFEIMASIDPDAYSSSPSPDTASWQD